MIIIVAISLGTVSTGFEFGAVDHDIEIKGVQTDLGNGPDGPRSYPVGESGTSSPLPIPEAALVNPLYPYDEQLGITFTQDFTSLAFNVTAVEQTGPEGLGPAYLLNGLSSTGYWYQVGLAWNWGYLTGGGYSSGFNMLYEVFSPNGTSVFPTTGGGGLLTLSVDQGDLVLLNLYFSGGDVIMLAKDWNTGSTGWKSYNAFGASYFIGLPSNPSNNGFFTGLMTEEYYSTQYNGTGRPVVYSESSYALSSAWMWIDEYNAVTRKSIFYDSTLSPLSYGVPSQFHFLSSNGTAEASNAHEFVTGLSSIVPPLLNVSFSGIPRTLASTVLVSNVEDPKLSLVIIDVIRVTIDFGTFYPSSGLPLNLTQGQGGVLNVRVNIPLFTRVGNHTVTTLMIWRFYDSEVSQWVVSESAKQSSLPIEANSLISFFTNPVGITITSLLVAIVVGSLGLLSERRRKQKTAVTYVSLRSCPNCGHHVEAAVQFCGSCGNPLPQHPNYDS